MPVLEWNPPTKLQSSKEWKDAYGFDSGPEGGYVPNMSEADKLLWKAKLAQKNSPSPQVEIRKTLRNGVQMLVIVNLGGGYNYKSYKRPDNAERHSYSTAGVNVHLALNGGGQMTFDEIIELNEAVTEAKVYLENYISGKKGHADAKATYEAKHGSKGG